MPMIGGQNVSGCALAFGAAVILVIIIAVARRQTKSQFLPDYLPDLPNVAPPILDANSRPMPRQTYYY